MSQQDADDSGRWPVISNDDQRSPAARANRPFGAARWNPRDADNLRICGKASEIRNDERTMAEEQGREWRGLGSRRWHNSFSARLRFARLGGAAAEIKLLKPVS